MSSSDLQALFSSLRPRSAQGRNATSPNPMSAQRTASSSLAQNGLPSTPSPPIAAIIDHSVAAVPAPNQNNSGRVTSNPTAQNLLNLLNFGGPLNSTSSKETTSGNVNTAQPTSKPNLLASDLVARMLSPSTDVLSTHTETLRTSTSPARQPLQDVQNTQSSVSGIGTHHESSGSANQTHMQADSKVTVGTVASADRNADEAQSENNIGSSNSASAGFGAGKSLFTYQNPFEALNASRTPTAKATVPQPQTPSFNFESSTGLGFSSPLTISARKKLTPKLPSQKSSISPQPESLQASTVPDPSRSLFDAQDPPHEGSAQAEIITPKIDARSNDLPVASNSVQPAKEEPANEVETVLQNAEGGDGSGEWEDADDGSDKVVSDRIVPVYNFPIKAFVSITLKFSAPSDIGIREGSVMEISRLKKEFDQIDRSLAAATSKYITYASTKNGGMRIIRQDDGSDRHVFKHSHDRIFNVALCTTSMTGPQSEIQNVLGTGVSGAVYYATISREGDDLFQKDQMNTESLIFPPWPQADENTAGGVLKTRAKRSSRHPEFFAIGRGKSIQIIWPSTALSLRYGISKDDRTVDVDLYYRERPLSIQTGKAGKDFTFSEDDTLIVSLDKTGRLRFWDIRPLIDESNATSARVHPVTVDNPILSLSTASPAEKSWPTSVLFVDKSRPYIKGGALRYVLVGLRQNHTLQLWDIALGKAVQEVHFSHESETDGICSVSYHPASGIIVVGHPTRNSIFFIHLSAPRYSLSSQLTQAAYVSRIASKDGDLAKPESTACMSGIREISFAEKGELRSVELLPIQKGSESTKSGDADQSVNAPLFELYVVHSKGVTCLAINKEDLGWNADSKVVQGIDAQKEGILSVKELRLGSVVEEPMRPKSPIKEAPPASKNSKKKAKKTTPTSEEVAAALEANRESSNGVLSTEEVAKAAASFNGVEPIPGEIPPQKESKKSKKKAAQNVEVGSTKQDTRSISPKKPVSAQASDKVLSRTADDATGLSAVSASQPYLAPSESTWSLELKKVQDVVSSEFRTEFATLQKNISSDRVSLDQSSLSRQEAIIRLVSTSLSTNVENSLSRIVKQQIQDDVLPNLQQIISDKVGTSISLTIEQLYTTDVSKAIPAAISSSIEKTLARSTMDAIGHRLASQMEKQVADVVVKTLTPLYEGIAQKAAESATNALWPVLTQQIQQLQRERAADQAQFDKLGQALQGMAKTLQAMSDSQVAFQDQILRERQQASRASNRSPLGTSHQMPIMQAAQSPVTVAQPIPIKPRSRAEIELEEISEMMNQGQYEEGTIKWLQSSQPVQLFDDVFVRYTPEYLASGISPLVAFSVAVTVANSLTTHIDRRLEWISIAFDAVDPMDPEMTDLAHHAPGLISAIIQKLESLYMTLAERRHDDPVLKAIPALVKKAREMRTSFALKNHDA